MSGAGKKRLEGCGPQPAATSIRQMAPAQYDGPPNNPGNRPPPVRAGPNNPRSPGVMSPRSPRAMGPHPMNPTRASIQGVMQGMVDPALDQPRKLSGVYRNVDLPFDAYRRADLEQGSSSTYLGSWCALPYGSGYSNFTMQMPGINQ
ncbi:hypothetical protein AJ80_04309 [Polytolypa hystricis UAMH7299]|uniref:Uncharacterized protein n=1 Tax=Polytolypa hystricis (strain UAMH7299) TaxID=1447883 RepID=A0A2B7YCV2_POLH7|nr:hypothetical protein AJ80_04309 [Polytolypa hystricis UAMH7299]